MTSSHSADSQALGASSYQIGTNDPYSDIGQCRHSRMVQLRFHLEMNIRTDVFWWIDSPQLPALYVWAARLREAQQQATDKLAAVGIDLDTVSYELVGLQSDQ